MRAFIAARGNSAGTFCGDIPCVAAKRSSYVSSLPRTQASTAVEGRAWRRLPGGCGVAHRRQRRPMRPGAEGSQSPEGLLQKGTCRALRWLPCSQSIHCRANAFLMESADAACIAESAVCGLPSAVTHAEVVRMLPTGPAQGTFQRQAACGWVGAVPSASRSVLQCTKGRGPCYWRCTRRAQTCAACAQAGACRALAAARCKAPPAALHPRPCTGQAVTPCRMRAGGRLPGAGGDVLQRADGHSAAAAPQRAAG